MLSLNNISKTFNPSTINEKKALEKLNLHLDKGDFVTIIGGNGAGKSTLFNLIGGSFLCDSGSVILDGENITFQKEHKRARNIGRLLQDPLKGTAPSMTIEENLCLSYSRGTRRRFTIGIPQKDKKMFKEILATLDLGLEDRMETKMGLLSGGQRQAITLLMSTIVTPKLLLLDEHIAALDPATAEKVINLTKKIVRKDNITTMMITHNISSALALGNRTIMMDKGKIIMDIRGKERDEMTTEKLLKMFKVDNDRMILTKD